MTTAFWAAGLSIGGIFGGALLCLPVTHRMPWRWLLATALYLTVDDEALINSPRIHGLHWNWVGKAASILMAFVAMGVFRLSREEVGLKVPKRGTWLWTFAGLTILVIGNLIRARGMFHQRVDIETLLYQATMPAFAEEFVYRGVAYALLLRAYGEERVRSSVWAAVLLPSCCFSLGHIELPQGPIPHEFFWMMIGYSALQFSFMFLFATLLAVMRWRSGSLLGPVFSHGSFNVVGMIAAGRV